MSGVFEITAEMSTATCDRCAARNGNHGRPAKGQPAELIARSTSNFRWPMWSRWTFLGSTAIRRFRSRSADTPSRSPRRSRARCFRRPANWPANCTSRRSEARRSCTKAIRHLAVVVRAALFAALSAARERFEQRPVWSRAGDRRRARKDRRSRHGRHRGIARRSGLSTVASAESAISAIASHAPEIMTEPLPETDGGSIAMRALDDPALAAITDKKT